MWRAFFWAVGLFTLLLGAQCLMIDKALLRKRVADKPSLPWAKAKMRPKEFVPPDWAPWSLLSLGAITILYSITIPRRAAG